MNTNKENRERCVYPENLFFEFEASIPKNTRISNPNDCKVCDEKKCEIKYCLIIDKKE